MLRPIPPSFDNCTGDPLPRAASRRLATDRQDLVTTIEIRDRTGRVIGTKNVATYAGLLGRAHEEGLKRVETKVIQLPTAQNGMTAVAWAQMETTKGKFPATADASPENTTARVGRFPAATAETP